jgi:hypothetical protein
VFCAPFSVVEVVDDRLESVAKRSFMADGIVQAHFLAGSNLEVQRINEPCGDVRVRVSLPRRPYLVGLGTSS